MEPRMSFFQDVAPLKDRVMDGGGLDALRQAADSQKKASIMTSVMFSDDSRQSWILDGLSDLGLVTLTSNSDRGYRSGCAHKVRLTEAGWRELGEDIPIWLEQ